MSLAEALRRRLERTGTTSYTCCLCSARFERRPLNCPSCGCTTIEPD